MDMICENNFVKLRGSLAGRPAFSHTARGIEFYSFPLEVLRLSGNSDTINIIARKEQLDALEVENKSGLCVTGQIRSFNNRSGQGAKLVITVFAKELSFCDGEDENLVTLKGTLCKEPKLRCTPMGRDICDLMLAVNRHYGRSDYLPCICWGQRAREASLFTVGTKLCLSGRVQSRNYIKLSESGAEEKTAFEVSVTELGLISE